MTVNGNVAGGPGVKVNILTAIVVANGKASVWLGLRSEWFVRSSLVLV